MQPDITIGLFFLALALVFSGLSYSDHLKSSGAESPARRTWVRIAIIFAAIGLLLIITKGGTGVPFFTR